MGFSVVVEKDGDGYHAYVPALKGLHVGGDTEEEAIENAKDAIVVYLRSLEKHGEPVPQDEDSIVVPPPFETRQVRGRIRFIGKVKPGIIFDPGYDGTNEGEVE